MNRKEVRFARSSNTLIQACAVLCAAASQASYAQQSAPSDATSVQRVEITGSAIRRADAETPSPVQTISADDLKKSGYTSISQVLQNITANGNGTLSQGFSGAFASGASGISLRGLTTAATLVLIDGHRMAPNALSDDNQRSFVDISNIPMDAVERVEILKDGASAVYGSDAMAGVVNIILKKNLTGTTVNAEAGTSTKGGGTTEHFSFSHGIGQLDEDGYNTYINVEYRHQDAISFAQRQGEGQWTRTDWTALGGIDTTSGSTQNPSTQPYPNTKVPYLIDPVSGAIVPAPGVTPCSTAQMNANACTYGFSGNLLPQTQNLNVLGSFDKRLADGWKLDVKASMFESIDNIFQLSGGFAFPTSGAYPGMVAGGPNVPLAGGVGATDVTYNGMALGGDIPGAPDAGSSKVTSKSYRFVTGLTGEIADWDIDSAIGYTKNIINVRYNALLNYSALQSALNNPTVPFSFTGNNSAAVISAIFPSSTQTDNSTLEFFDLHAQRSLAQLPGGDLGFSTGVSYIRRDMNAPDAPASIYGTANGAATAWVVGKQTDASAFAEIAAPVLRSLEIDGAVRFDHFDGGVGNATTPKLGFKWTPSNSFALRGTLATGFRAPNPAENGNAGTAFGIGNLQDPTLCPNGPTAQGAVVKYCNYPAVYFSGGNPTLSPEKSDSGTLGVILEPIKGWATTIDMYKIKIKNQIVTGPSSDLPSYGPAENQVCATGVGTNTAPCAPGQFNNTGTPLYYLAPYVNANQTSTSGVELNSSYKFKLGDYGTLRTVLDYTHMFSYLQEVDGVQYQLAGTHGPSAVGGDTGTPKDRIQATFTWDRDAWSVTTAFNYVSGYDLTDPTPAGSNVMTCSDGGSYGGWFPNENIPSNYCRVASFLDTDVTVYYKVSKNLQVHFNITNILNRQPPVDLATYGGMGLPYNPSMHEAGVIGRFVNAGLNYTF